MNRLHLATLAFKMYQRSQFLILILSFVGGYKLSEYEHLSNINSSRNISDADSSIDPLSFDGKHTTYEALKNIQNNVYPKLYKTTEPNGHTKSSRNITLDDIKSENLYTKLDQSLVESKHANIDGGSAESNLHMTNLLLSGNNHNVTSILQLLDPLFLMAVLGFIAYVINAVLCLVERLHLTKLLGTPATPFYSIHRRQQEAITPSLNVNQNFLQDLERIFRLAIEVYERKI